VVEGTEIRGLSLGKDSGEEGSGKLDGGLRTSASRAFKELASRKDHYLTVLYY
jgi:hypothetical protein